MMRLVADNLGRPFVPDDHCAAAAPLALVDSLEVPGRQLVVLNRNGKSPDGRIQRWPLRHRPRPQHAICLDPEVIVQPGRVMQLDHEPGVSHSQKTTAGCQRTGQLADAMQRAHSGNEAVAATGPTSQRRARGKY